MSYKYIKNLVSGRSADFYVYGVITDEKDEFWDGESAVDPMTLKNELEELQGQGIQDLNIYINSPGGSVFAASTLISMLNRFRQTTGAKIHSYIDGLAASAASFLALAADDVNIYQNSVMMIHKPWSFSMGNSDDLRKDAELLDQLENNTMLPLYMAKAKVSKEEIISMISAETWLFGNPEDSSYIGNFFEVNALDEERNVTACTSSKLFDRYQRVPEALKANAPVAEEGVEKSEPEGHEIEETVEKPVEKPEETPAEPVENKTLDKTENTNNSYYRDIIDLYKANV